MDKINGISVETLAGLAEQGLPIDGDEESKAINEILFDRSVNHSNDATLPEGLNDE